MPAGSRISSSSKQKSGQKYQNVVAFHHNKGSKLTKKILESPIHDVCRKCRDMIEWRKRYRKYKPLTVPKKCVKCEQKTIKEAYHIICHTCAHAEKNVPSKRPSYAPHTCTKLSYPALTNIDPVALYLTCDTRLRWAGIVRIHACLRKSQTRMV